MIRLSDGFSGERSIVLPDMIQRHCAEDMFLRQLYITDIGYYPHAIFHYRERPEGVNQYIIIYCVKGSGWYELDGRRYEVKANRFFIIPKHHPHVYASNNDDPWTIYWLHFDGTLAPVFGDDYYEPKEVDPGITSRITDRITIFEEIFLTLSDSYDNDNLCYASSLLYGFLSTFRFLKLFRKYNSNNDRIDTTDIISTAARYMKENIEKQLTLKQLADYMGYSTSQFSLIFRNGTGHSPLNYFNMLKIHRACEYLETTNLKINQICSKVGIDDSYYFSRLFSKIVGISPREYRKRVQRKALPK